MPRFIRQETEAFGSDSFTDVVTNVVGILIILVIVAGLRMQRAPLDAADSLKDQVELKELSTMVRSAASAQSMGLRTQKALTRDVIVRRQEVERLAALINQRERGLEKRRGALAAEEQIGSDAQRELAVADAYLARLRSDLAAAETARPEAITVESYPTPIARTVEGKEAHFQLQGGLIVFVPVDDLVEKVRADAVQQIWKLRDLPEATDTIGPIGGFRMRYTMRRVDVSGGERLARQRAGSYAQLAKWTLIPTSAQLGETVDEALAERSQFRGALGRLKPGETTITIWVYPDGFGDFRRLKKELYTLGFATAGRPLPAGQPIGGSPEGSKSAAE